jgi:hypothetical protein
MIHKSDRLHRFEPQLLGHDRAGRGLIVHAHHKILADLRCEFQQPQMAWMDDIEIPGDKDDTCPRRDCTVDVFESCLGIGMQRHQLTSNGPRHGTEYGSIVKVHHGSRIPHPDADRIASYELLNKGLGIAMELPRHRAVKPRAKYDLMDLNSIFGVRGLRR